ncbi:DUF4116 domain-containing protein [Streptobacillus moniliformis]|uniref:DUF4116 domain-containing protein n=1 Tax=Streptobacillus moniliformis TaxID=34105 RepID=UPI0007E37A4B|nr:DUF4116 domain-containing protein [Streptobacillus moniliformis]
MNKNEDMSHLLYRSICVEKHVGTLNKEPFIVDVDNEKRIFTVYSQKNPQIWREYILHFDYLEVIKKKGKANIIEHSQKIIDEKLESYEKWKKDIYNYKLLKIEKGKVNDEEIMLKAIKENSYFFNWGSDELKSNKEFVLKLVKKGFNILRYVDEKFRDDKEIVMIAIEKDSYSLEYASERLKNDKEVVMKAVEKNFYSLRYASEEIRKEILKKN